MIKEFIVRPEHIKLLQNSYWELNEDMEWGSWMMDPKRPFGNSDVPEDIYKICDWKISTKQKYEGIGWHDKKARGIFKELGTVIQIMIDTLSLKPGKYINKGDYYHSKWVYEEPEFYAVYVFNTEIVE